MALTLSAAVVQGAKALAAAGVENARLEAEIFASHVLQKPRSYLYAHGEHALLAARAGRLSELIAARCGGEPVAYLVKRCEFWSLPLFVDQRVLIPRSETECLVEAILDLPLAASAHVVDLGTGSGAIALALACERQDWLVAAADRLPGPLQVAQRNIASLSAMGKVKRAPLLLQASWLDACAGQCFDLVVANPPYIARSDAHLQRGDLRFEPLSALASDDDGFSDLSTICHQAIHCLNAGGFLALEHGCAQQPGLVALLEKQHFQIYATGRDLAGQPRFVIAQKPA